MARYEHLPLYKTAMELTVYIGIGVRNLLFLIELRCFAKLVEEGKGVAALLLNWKKRKLGQAPFITWHVERTHE